MKSELVLLVFFTSISISACSNQKTLESKMIKGINNEVISDDHDLSSSVRALILQSPKLSLDQRTSLITIQDQNAKLFRNLKSEIVKNQMQIARC